MTGSSVETHRMRIGVFDAKSYDEKYFAEANVETKFQIRYFPVALSKDTVELAKGCDALCLFVNDTCDATILDRAAELGVKLVLMRCAGYDRVDLEAAAEAGISVVRVPAYSPHAVAEFAVGLLMCLNRRLHLAYNRVRDGNFMLAGLDGFDLFGKTVGVIGTGKIGQCFIDIMIGFGCKILAFDEYINKTYEAKPQVTYTTLDNLLKESDVISLHVPLLESTRYIINEASIAKMKPTAVLVNTSRGGLVDTSALVEALKHKRIGGAALDVYEEEEGYFFEDRSADVILDDVLARLQNMKNCIITSHQAFFTQEALRAISSTTIANAKEFCEGKRFDHLTNCVKPPGYNFDEQRLRSRGMTFGAERVEAMKKSRSRRASQVNMADVDDMLAQQSSQEHGIKLSPLESHA